MYLEFYRSVYTYYNYIINDEDMIFQINSLKCRFLCVDTTNYIKSLNLLESECHNINELNVKMQIVLLFASMYNNIENIKELLARGIHRNIKFGHTTFIDYLSESSKQIICDYIEELDSVIIKPAKR